jgi:enoyl-CoA hydratase/carnithine racemase
VIPILVFYLHVVAIAGAFTKRWQEEGLVEGFLVVFFMALVFFVGWSISSFILKLFMPQAGLGYFFDRDAASLLLLTAGEGILYYFYTRKDPTAEKAKEVGS